MGLIPGSVHLYISLLALLCRNNRLCTFILVTTKKIFFWQTKKVLQHFHGSKIFVPKLSKWFDSLGQPISNSFLLSFATEQQKCMINFCLILTEAAVTTFFMSITLSLSWAHSRPKMMETDCVWKRLINIKKKLVWENSLSWWCWSNFWGFFSLLDYRAMKLFWTGPQSLILWKDSQGSVWI